MKKEEIKKWLKCCTMSNFRIGCKNCPYYQTDKCNHDTLCEDALNLINEQEKEIERLKAVLEIEKKQAVKEFAEKLKAKAVQEAEVEDYVCYIVNRLLKRYEK